MRKIIQYMMMALIAVVLASCANDISEESTPTVKSNIRFVVDDFPMFEKPSTRTIGEEDNQNFNIICFSFFSSLLMVETIHSFNMYLSSLLSLTYCPQI